LAIEKMHARSKIRPSRRPAPLKDTRCHVNMQDGGDITENENALYEDWYDSDEQDVFYHPPTSLAYGSSFKGSGKGRTKGKKGKIDRCGKGQGKGQGKIDSCDQVTGRVKGGELEEDKGSFKSCKKTRHGYGGQYGLHPDDMYYRSSREAALPSSGACGQLSTFGAPCKILSTRNAPCKSLGDAVMHHSDDADDLNGAPRGRRVDDGGVSGDTQGDDNDDAIYGRYYDDIVTRVNSQKPCRDDIVTCATTTTSSACLLENVQGIDSDNGRYYDDDDIYGRYYDDDDSGDNDDDIYGRYYDDDDSGERHGGDTQGGDNDDDIYGRYYDDND